MATIIKTNGERIEVSPKDETKGFTLEELTDIVDGYIEIIRLNDSQIMVINDEKIYCKKNSHS